MSELEDPSDTQGPAMEDMEALEGRGLPTATLGPPPSHVEVITFGKGRTHRGTRPGARKDTEALGGLPRAQPGRLAGSGAGGTWLGSGPRRAT